MYGMTMFMRDFFITYIAFNAPLIAFNAPLISFNAPLIAFNAPTKLTYPKSK